MQPLFTWRAISLLAALAAIISQPLLAEDHSQYAIVGVDVIPMDSERILENQVVVIEDGVIQSVSDLIATTLPRDLPQVDGAGRYLMPGLADLHVHLRNEDELINYVDWGVTTVMHLGGSGESGQQQLRYRDEILSGNRVGPHIYATDRILDGDPAVGQVLPGYRADLILLDANPLEDVRNARAISSVITNGRYIEKSELEQRRAKLAESYSKLTAIQAEVDALLAEENFNVRLKELVGENRDQTGMANTIEARVNAAGFAGDLDRAKALLKLNTELFPDSPNTWDSLAEVTLYLGDKQRAIDYYRKALELDPNSANAAEQIDAIEKASDK